MRDEGRSAVQLKTIALFLFFPNFVQIYRLLQITEERCALREERCALREERCALREERCALRDIPAFAHLQIYRLLQMAFRNFSYIQEHG
jgi:hypothetical protein